MYVSPFCAYPFGKFGDVICPVITVYSGGWTMPVTIWILSEKWAISQILFEKKNNGIIRFFFCLKTDTGLTLSEKKKKNLCFNFKEPTVVYKNKILDVIMCMVDRNQFYSIKIPRRTRHTGNKILTNPTIWFVSNQQMHSNGPNAYCQAYFQYVLWCAKCLSSLQILAQIILKFWDFGWINK